jgi:hydroxyacylglutathione hydrolase
MLHDDRQAIVIDPGDAAPVAAALDAQGLALVAILVTHHHPDHVGGVAALRPRLLPSAGQVWGPAREKIPQPCTPLNDGDSVALMGLRLQVIDVPGHTAGHIAFFLPAADSQEPILFCGDTLFSGGCGRLFDGTAAQMHQSLGKLAALPGNTRVCCAHEYTESNLRFAAAVEPHSTDLAAYTAHCRALRAQGRPTLPSTIAQERAINPFMRCDTPAVIDAAQRRGAADHSGPAVLGALREWKNQF